MSPPIATADRSRHPGFVLAPDLRFVPLVRGTDGGLLHRRSTGLVVRIGSAEWEVLRRFDGCEVQRVRERAERECGMHLDVIDMDVFVRRAHAIGLLEREGQPTINRSRWRGLSWRLPIWNPERFFAWCAPRASILFHPLAVAGGVLTIAIACLTMIDGASRSAPSSVPIWLRIALFITLLNVVSILHECGHGLTLHRCGGSVREIGIRFVLGWPCWYCDITESYLLPRLRQRLGVLVAGPFVQAVLCGATILAARGDEPHVAALRNQAALLGGLSALNFFPLVRSDGYYLLTELVGLPNLRTDAWKWLASSAARERWRVKLPRFHRLAIAGYAFCSVAFYAVVLGRVVSLLGSVIVGARPFSVHTATMAASATVILVTVITRRRGTS